MLWRIYELVHAYANGQFLFGGVPGGIGTFICLLLFSSLIVVYALYYGMTGRRFWGGFFRMFFLALGVGILLITARTLYDGGFENLYLVYSLCLIGVLCFGLFFYKVQWRYGGAYFLKYSAGFMLLLGAGLVLNLLYQFLGGEVKGLEFLCLLIGPIFFSLVFLDILRNALQPDTDINWIEPVKDWHAGDSVCLGAWVHYLSALAPKEASAFLEQAAQETGLSAETLQQLKNNEGRPAVVIKAQGEQHHIQFDNHPDYLLELGMKALVLDAGGVNLLFQPLPLFLVPKGQLRMYRNRRSLLDAIHKPGAQADATCDVYDALGYTYSISPEGLLSLSTEQPQAEKLKTLLSAYLEQHNMVLPKPVTLPGLVSAVHMRMVYADA